MKTVRLRKQEDRRVRAGHLWIYSNEIDTTLSPFKNYTAGELVQVEASDKTVLGIGYINPQSLITVRLLSRFRDTIDEAWFVARLQQALGRRDHYYSRPFYRWVFGESDQLPGLVIDRFDKDIVVQLNTAGMEHQKAVILSAIQHVIPTVHSILFRNDSSMRRHEGIPLYVEAGLGTPPERVIVEENDTLFSAPLWSGQKTGWFYDHRLNRSRLQSYVSGKRVLDVFSYLGGWGIHAATVGARDVLCVDVSAPATEWIQKNAALNQVGDKVHTLCEDAFVALKSLAEANETFDVIILDPPAFVKKLKDKKEGMLAYQRINELALRVLNPNGVLISCSCSMHLSIDDLVQTLRRASLTVKRPLHIIERGHQGHDHPVHLAIPETDYLKMVVVS